MKICDFPPKRVFVKAMYLLSGDHDGNTPSAILGKGLMPCGADISRMFIAGGNSTVAIYLPSGDHTGLVGPSTNFATFVPSQFMTNTPGEPSWAEENASCFPSGDHVGNDPSTGWRLHRPVNNLRCEPSGAIVYICGKLLSCTASNAIC